MNYGTRTGDFTTKSFPAGFSYGSNSGPLDYLLAFGDLTNRWQGLTGDWGATPGAASSNWSLGHVPTADEVVEIPDVGAPGPSNTITVNAGGQRAKSITNAETLQIASGELLFTDASTSNGVLQLNGGTLAANGALSANTLTQTGGTLAGAGGVSVFGAWNYTAGDINTALTLGSAVNASLANVAVSGSGNIVNLGTLTVTDSTLSVPIGTAPAPNGASSRIRFTNTGASVVNAGITGGNVDFAGGTTTFAAGSRYGSVGTTDITGSTVNFDNPGTAVNSTGTLVMNSGTLMGTGGLAVGTAWSYAAGEVNTTLTLATGSNSTLGNGGAVAVTVAGTGKIVNEGMLNLAGATVVPEVTLAASGTLKTAAASVNELKKITSTPTGEGINDGTIDLGSLSVLVVPGALDNRGMIKGEGTLTLGNGGTVGNPGTETLTNNGWVAPGASPGVLVIDGNFVQGPDGNLAIEVDGMSPGTQYDQLQVTGTVSLAGNLHVVLPNGFAPVDGNSFTVMQYGSRTGDFTLGIDPPGYTINRNGSNGSYTITFFSTAEAAATAIVPPPALPAAVVQEAIEVTSSPLVTETANLTALAGPGAPGGGTATQTVASAERETSASDTQPASTTATGEGEAQQGGATQRPRKPPVCR
jgi:hypothetical protein